MQLLTYAFAAALLLVPPASAPVEPSAAPITFRQLLSRERAKADHRIPYGPEALNFGELWLPQGPGPHPVVVLIHGGCWRADLPGLELMDYLAEALRRDGKAVWNIEYRRIGGGGGYPETFMDVAHGVDHLRHIAAPYRLDLDRVVLSGPSAGGHLALWAAARPRLPEDSPLHMGDPVRARGIVTLAGINDLEAYRTTGPDACGGPGTIDRLLSAEARAGRPLYADTSPPALLPLGARQVVVSGALDHIVPSRFGADYVRAAAAAGDPAQEIDLAGAGHFELIDPTSAAWPRIRAAFDDLLDQPPVARD